MRNVVPNVRPRLLLVGGLVVAALLLGGGTRSGHLSDAILQAISVPVLVWAIVTPTLGNSGHLAWGAIGIASLSVILPIAQLIPVSSLHSNGPAAQFVAEIGKLIGFGEMAHSLSVSPRATLLAALAGLPALAVFLGATRFSLRERQQLALVVLLAGGISVFLGLLQVAEGPNSQWRFFSLTNPTEAVGFFANRNHFSAFLYVLLLFAASWAVIASREFIEASPKRRADPVLIVRLVVSLTAVVVFVAAQTYTRSRAGVGLGMLALVAILVLFAKGRRKSNGSAASRLIFGAVVVGIFLTVQFALYRIIERFDADPLSDARVPFATNTFEAAREHLPFGSGFATFVPIYGLFEKSSDALVDTFANRAHNDFLEIWLETGVPGALLFVCFVVWFLFALRSAWMTQREGSALDAMLARAASIAIALLLLHSLVDYPLRTAALQCLFAMSCALLIPPPELRPGYERAEEKLSGAEKELLPRPARASGMQAKPQTIASWPERDAVAETGLSNAKPGAKPLARGEPWGSGVEWPVEWQRPAPAPARDRSPPAKPDGATPGGERGQLDDAFPPHIASGGRAGQEP